MVLICENCKKEIKETDPCIEYKFELENIYWSSGFDLDKPKTEKITLHQFFCQFCNAPELLN